MNRSITVYSFNDIVHEYKMTKNGIQLKLLTPMILMTVDRKISCDRILCSEALHNFLGKTQAHL